MLRHSGAALVYPVIAVGLSVLVLARPHRDRGAVARRRVVRRRVVGGRVGLARVTIRP